MSTYDLRSTGKTPGTSRTCSGQPAGAGTAGLRGVVHRDGELIGRAVIEEGAEVSASRIVGPVIVGARTRVADPVPGRSRRWRRTAPSPTARSKFRSCCRGASISGVRRIEALMIGRDVEVTPAPRVPRPTDPLSAITARCRSAHEDPGEPAGRCSSAPTTSAPSSPAVIRATSRPGSRCWTSSPMREPGQPGSGRREPAAALRPGRHQRRHAPASLLPGHDAAPTSPPRRMWTGLSTAPPISSPQTWWVCRSCCRPASTWAWPRGPGSTDEVYGSIAEGSWTEDAPLAPNSLYSAAKAGWLT